MSAYHNAGSECFAALQRLLPQHTLSRLLAKLAQAQTPWLKNYLIRQFIRAYQIDLDDPISSSPEDFASFNDFFTRRLKPEARPIAASANTIVSPADGFISQIGDIRHGELIQAKGLSYTASRLLGEPAHQLGNFQQGEFATIYLSPRDYHRVHAPLTGQLLFSRYIPGRLFSVDSATTNYIDNLFTRNERLVCLFETAVGKCAVVMVGAMLVAGIASVWHGRYQPNVLLETDHSKQDIALAKGAELGQFHFGSTVILLFEQQPKSLLQQDLLNTHIQMGRQIGVW